MTPGSPTPRSSKPGRVRSLDGLRGAASLIVFLHHTMLTVPVLAGAYYAAGPLRRSDPVAWLVTYSPLHFVWAGSEAVDLFFILSGLVLTLPALGRTRDWWVSYYPSRVIRLYVPVVATVALAYVLVALVPRTNVSGLGAWLEHRPKQITGLGALRDVTLVNGVSGVVSTLWSLQWEVLFSVGLPAFFLVAIALRRVVPLHLGILAAAMLWGGVTYDGRLLFLPIFAVGVAMAVDFEKLSALAQKIQSLRWAGCVWTALTAIAVVLFTSYWWLQAFGQSRWLYAATRPTIVAGAAVLVFIAAFARPARRLLETRLLQQLGLISFSLYLVHEPIVIAASIVAGPDLRWLAIVLGTAAALGTAVAFHRYIERPSHRWARTVANAISVRTSPRRQTQTP